MTIEINNQTIAHKSVAAPTVQIEGGVLRRNSTETTTKTYNTHHQYMDGINVRTRDVDTFYRSALVTIIQDSSLGAKNSQPKYRSDAGSQGIFVGEQPGGLSQNSVAETYVTVNGKDPKRTKANLYTNPFYINSNVSGDNVIIKARTYVNGLASEVRKVEIRIVQDKNDLRVNRRNF